MIMGMFVLVCESALCTVSVVIAHLILNRKHNILSFFPLMYQNINCVLI